MINAKPDTVIKDLLAKLLDVAPSTLVHQRILEDPKWAFGGEGRRWAIGTIYVVAIAIEEWHDDTSFYLATLETAVYDQSPNNKLVVMTHEEFYGRA